MKRNRKKKATKVARKSSQTSHSKKTPPPPPPIPPIEEERGLGVPNPPEGEGGNERGAYKEHMKKPFLLAFRKTGTIFGAVGFLRDEMSLHLDRRTVQNWRKTDKDFRELFTEADLDIFEKVEGTALQRAVNGIPHFLYQLGEVVVRKDANGNPLLDADGKPQPVVLWREYSDALQTFFMRTRGGDKYKEKIKHELDVKLIAVVTKHIAEVCQRAIPTTCPNCKVVLGITPRMLRELQDVSLKLGQSIAGNSNGNGNGNGHG